MEPDTRIREEATLRRAVLRGDPVAWRALYDTAFDPLYRYVRFRLRRDEDRTAEVVQEVWMIAVRKIRKFDPEQCSFEVWLKAIANNVLRNEHRRAQRQPATVDVEAQPPPAPPVALPEDAEQIALAMTELPAAYQAILRARYEGMHSVAEIAAQRGTTPKAAESLLARARAAFRAAYTRIDNG